MSAGLKLAKCLLVCFNILFWLSGIALMALGLFVLITLQSDDLLRSIRDKSLEVDREVFWVSIGMIAVGFISFLVGFCGCCGAIRDSTAMNGFYITLLVLIVGAEITGSVFTIIYRPRIETLVQDALGQTVRHHYTHSNNSQSIWLAVSSAFDRAMYQGKCCGVKNYTDWWNSTYMIETGFYPIYCCQLKVGANYTSPLVNSSTGQCEKNSKFVHTKSCATALHEFIHMYTIIVIAVLCSFAAIQLAGILFASFFCHRLLHPEDEMQHGHEEEREPMANDKEDA